MIQSRIRSKMMGVLSSSRWSNWQKSGARYLRHFRLEKPKVYYFHQADDPYSHLAVQKLAELKSKYLLEFEVHLVNKTEDVYKGDVVKFDTLARQDAESIACHFNSTFSPTSRPSNHEIKVANGLLASCLSESNFPVEAIQIGEKLWSGQLAGKSKLESGALCRKGSQIRKRLGHYLGGTFYFEGEWYWSVDRLHLLEKRLQAEGFGDGGNICPLPSVEDFHVDGLHPEIVLEYFPSLRSPYSAIGHARVMDLVEKTGIQLKLRPVMPMMMRGVPAPLLKQRYIMSDSGREARHYDVAFGPFCDPFGEPIKKAFAAYHCASEQGLGLGFVTEFLKASFAEGLNICVKEGLAIVCERAGFDIKEIDPHADWEKALGENLSAMAEGSLWGVPSFRLSGGNEEAPYSCWGQDRIWRVAAEIKKRSSTGDHSTV
jgi:2-hydroxychromene-2-carboxylate isomerase